MNLKKTEALHCIQRKQDERGGGGEKIDDGDNNPNIFKLTSGVVPVEK